jgi:tRNA (guanine26-N2/guanine27-N2)-dimethyltransferase
MEVFYNPKSELNRDITVVALQVFISHYKKTKVRVCTPLAGTGVRPIRIAKEVSEIEKVIAGDANPQAVRLIERNMNLNDVKDLVEVFHKEANQLLGEFVSIQERFDVIDIDPFGSPRGFFDASFRALRPPAMLCLTATDMPVLVGIRRRTCIKRYAAIPLKTEYAHELAVRILMGCAVREAAARNIGLAPLLSFSVDHYVRLYCVAKEGDANTWKSFSQLGFITQCNGCGQRKISKGLIPESVFCNQCKSEDTQVVGPLWIGKLGDRKFVEKMYQILDTFALGKRRRVFSLLNTILAEVDGPPTYYDLHQLADKLNIPVPPFQKVIEKLSALGEFCVRTHFSNHAIRTSANEQTLRQILFSLTTEE